MEKVIGVLGCGGAVGRNVINYLGHRHKIIGGQRSPIDVENENFEWIKTDIYNPKSLNEFCKKCDIVINSASPSSVIKTSVAECAAANGIDYVDTSGESIYIERNKGILGKSNTSFVIGAGFEAGLSALIPYYFSQLFDKVEVADCYLGSRQRISKTSLRDLLCSCFIDSGYANACYQNGEIVHKKVAAGEKHKLLGFREEVYIKPFISNETIIMAKQCNIGTVNWYHAIADPETMEITNTMFEKIHEIDGENFQEELVKKYMKVFDAITNTKPFFNSMLYDFTGIKAGEKIRKAAICQIDEAYKLCGIVSAHAAEQLLKNEVKKGVSWACEILDAKEVIDLLTEEKVIRDFKIINMPIDREREAEMESGEL